MKNSRKPDETMIPTLLMDELIFQYENLFHVLAVSIRQITHKQWTSGASPFQTPVRQACHILWACEMYATKNQEGCSQRFGCPVESLDGDLSVDNLPTTIQVLEYLEIVQVEVKNWLGSIKDEDLLKTTPNWGWRERGMTVLGHITYVLRHATLHLGQLQAELYSRGIQGGVFR